VILGILLFLVVLLVFSLWLRMRRGRQGIDSEMAKASPFSMAVQELVSTAGGVYLSFIMLTSFLKLDIPEKMLFGGVAFDPLAGMALGLAIVQPLCGLLFYKLSK
jgi:hypothetical protein